MVQIYVIVSTNYDLTFERVKYIDINRENAEAKFAEMVGEAHHASECAIFLIRTQAGNDLSNGLGNEEVISEYKFEKINRNY